MPGKNVVETLFEQHADGLPKTKEQERGRSVWKESQLHVPDHRTPVVEISRGSVLLGRIERPWSDADNGSSRLQHESPLRARESDVDAPLVHSEIDRAESADDIDEEQRVETRAIDGPAHRAQVGRDSGGGLVVNDQDRAVLGSQIRFYVRLGDRVAPSQLDLVDLHAEFACSFRVEASEVTILEAQDALARIKRVDDRRFPSSRAAAREEDRSPRSDLKMVRSPARISATRLGISGPR